MGPLASSVDVSALVLSVQKGYRVKMVESGQAISDQSNEP